MPAHRGPTFVGSQPSDPWFARLAFYLLREVGPGWLTAWLLIILGTLLGLTYVAGPWMPGIITVVVSGIAGVGAAVVRTRASRPGAPSPDPALDPPP